MDIVCACPGLIPEPAYQISIPEPKSMIYLIMATGYMLQKSNKLQKFIMHKSWWKPNARCSDAQNNDTEYMQYLCKYG